MEGSHQEEARTLFETILATLHKSALRGTMDSTKSRPRVRPGVIVRCRYVSFPCFAQ
jgi:hypothetical protein